VSSGDQADAAATVASVDDHEAVRLGLRAACFDAGYRVVAETANVPDLLAALAGSSCDVVVLDLSLGDGSSVTENVRAVLDTGSAVLVHSIADRVAAVRHAHPAGAGA
jgi:two-component system uhpT operon response regulator UhpA